MRGSCWPGAADVPLCPDGGAKADIAPRSGGASQSSPVAGKPHTRNFDHAHTPRRSWAAILRLGSTGLAVIACGAFRSLPRDEERHLEWGRPMKRRAGRSCARLHLAALLAGVSLSTVAAHAQNATWNLNGTGDFNTAGN